LNTSFIRQFAEKYHRQASRPDKLDTDSLTSTLQMVHSTYAKKSLGQNFLVDSRVVEKIVDALAPAGDDIVLEIGPGRGALTERLIEQAGRVYALEFDRDLAPALRQRFADRENFSVLEGDALQIDFRKIHSGDRKLRLIANLPYNVSTAILQRLFEYPDVFSDCVLMFQREVAARITAKPGTKERGSLSVMTELYFLSDELFDVPPDAFRPVPKVWSTVIRLSSKEHRVVPTIFTALLNSGFAQKRKTIANNLKARFPNSHIALERAELDPRRRAETLTLEEWLRLSEAVTEEQ
jgi:16S rRNA (adenine1518-N6/adenine1519-N6)-dimethyltransferase